MPLRTTWFKNFDQLLGEQRFDIDLLNQIALAPDQVPEMRRARARNPGWFEIFRIYLNCVVCAFDAKPESNGLHGCVGQDAAGDENTRTAPLRGGAPVGQQP